MRKRPGRCCVGIMANWFASPLRTVHLLARRSKPRKTWAARLLPSSNVRSLFYPCIIRDCCNMVKGVFRSTSIYALLSVVNVAGLLRVIKSMSLFKWLFLHGQTTKEIHSQSALWQRFFQCALKFIARLYRYFH